MQKSKTYLFIILLCLFLFVACTHKNKTETDGNLSIAFPDVTEEGCLFEKQDSMENFVLLAPKNELILKVGTTCIGIYDKSREILHLSYKKEGNDNIIYLNDEKQFTVSDDSIVMLYDIAKDDAYLELIVAKPVFVNSSNSFLVNIYRIHPEGIATIPIFPKIENNSFLIKDWYWLSFREGVIQVQPENTEEINFYQLVADGYFVPWEEDLITIHTDTNVVYVPKNNTAISKNNSLGIAFEPVYTMAGTTHYNIYQTIDNGVSWSLIVEDYIKESAEIKHIYISNKGKILCFFGKSGVIDAQHISIHASEDGGKTWSSYENIY